MITVRTPDDLLGLIGRDLGTSTWLPVTQPDVNDFARATRDEQWIHTDPERARTGPFGGTIAHGYLTVALLSPLFTSLLQVEQCSMIVNYGIDRLRFPSAVPVGDQVRLGAVISDVLEVPNGVQLVADAVMSRAGGDKPVLVAQVLYRYFR